ncbi:hypothetical protein CALVIDRAFT_600189 [Calocera viscosa TUFC12733]|uniref:Epidermal growth factor receptor-like transmembrane-juxtamembrane segment domain-containing protein n=1 Tax=Calocera viscosa (strain TUFC12733) TaxID=1330018 RepID=A0A167K5E5_CALVF|nr:hypothetical protein CALVIDRAFT_600189 [Calocera viscosa TUFC12733]
MAVPTINTTIPSTSGSVDFAPNGDWFSISAPGATDGQAEFDRGDSVHGLSQAFITYTFSQPATGFQYWAYQRSDGGLFSICFDCPPTSTLGDRIDALNTSTNGTEPPRLLYSKYDLSYAVHNVTIANLFDQRATINNATNGAYGQITMDRFVLITPATPPSSSAGAQSSTHSSGSTSASGSPSSSAAAGTSGSAGSSQSNTGAIAGGVIGGIAVIAIIAALIFFFMRRRNQRPGSSVYESKYEAVPNAFVLGPAPRGNNTAISPWSSEAPATYATSPPAPPTVSSDSAVSPPLPPVGYTGSRRAKGSRQAPAPRAVRASQPQTSPSVYPATSESSWPTSTNDTVVPRREQDAGFLQGDEDEGPTLPPDYSAATARRRPAGPN